jgi:anti-anti-sigma factor
MAAEREIGSTDVPPAFELETEQLADDSVVIRVRGELDLANAGAVESALLGQAASDPARVIVDLSECTFVDSSGLRSLIVGHRVLTTEAGATSLPVVIRPESHVSRLLEMTGMDEILSVFFSVEDAHQRLAHP